ncbi:MAG: hypothetical protein QXT28_10465 [Thermofilaceae archaeon]
MQLPVLVEVLTQVQQPPTPDIGQIKDPLYTAISTLYLSLAILTVIIGVVKILYGGVLKGTGAPGISARGATEIIEGFLGIFWYLVAIVILPWVIYFLSLAKIIPPEVANEVQKALLYIIWKQQ